MSSSKSRLVSVTYADQKAWGISRKPAPFEDFLCALCRLARHILAPPSPPPPTPWNNLPNEPIFPSNSNKLKPLVPFRVEATYPGPSLPGNIKGGTHAPPRSLGSPRKPAKFGPFSNPSERRLESRPQRGPQPRMAALLPGDFRHARHARKITALEERRRGAAGSQPRTLLAIVALTGEDGPFLCPQDASTSQRHTQLLTVGFGLHQSPSAGGPAEP